MRERERPKSTRSWGAVLDDVVGFFSPEAAARRRAWRDMETFSSASYRAARHTRLGRGRPIDASADYHLEHARDRRDMVDRARQIERDNALADGLLTRSVENVVGTGIKPQARTADSDWNDRAERLFDAWALEADIRGMDSFWELQALAYRSMIRDGDVGCIKLRNGQIQMVESDQIAAPLGKELTRNHVDGIDVDLMGKPIAYYIVSPEPDRTFIPLRRDRATRVKVDARDFIFIAKRERLGQTRGNSCFSQTWELFDQIDGLIEAVIVAARMAACFGAVLETPHKQNRPQTTGADGVDHQTWKLTPGLVQRLRPGEKFTGFNPTQPTQNFSEFVSQIARMLGLQLGLPLELIFMDFSRTNYSSARASLIQAQRAFVRAQSHMTNHFLNPIWAWKVTQWMEDGLLEAREDWNLHGWITPAFAWVDPVKEAQAAQMAVDSGFKTVREVVTSQGRDFLSLLEQRQREISQFDELGIPQVRSVMTRDPMVAFVPADDEDEDDEDEDRDAA